MNILSQAKKAIAENPAQITAKEFYARIEENPAIFKDWETPLEITEFVDCNQSPITHLSKHLTFSKKNKFGNSASFYKCPNLKIATGTFAGHVDFQHCGIEKIENLNVGKNYDDNSAWFFGCKKLKIATGNFAGLISFRNSGIHKIENLNTPRKNGHYGDFHGCPNLKTLEGWDLSKPIGIEPKKLAAEKERRALKKFQKETNPSPLPFL
jgi:hypothetical protein